MLAIIRVTFPEGERARAIGYFGTTLGLASIAAQLVGGALVQADIAGLGWRPIFLVNVPVGAVALFFAARTLRDSRAQGRPTLDFGGILLATLTLGLLIYPLVEGAGLGWPWWVAAMLALSVPALGGFILYELHLQHRGRSPLVSMRLFRDPAFSLGLVMVVTFFAGLAAFFMGLTIFLQQGFGYGPLATGIVFVAFGIGFVGASLLSSRVARRLGPLTLRPRHRDHGHRPAGHRGPGERRAWRPDQPGGAVAGADLLRASARAWPCPRWWRRWSAAAASPRRRRGAASGVFTMLQQVAFALGVAIIMGLFFSVLGGGTTHADYERALSVALSCNAGLMAATCVLAFFLPRRAPVPGVFVHVE